MNSLTAEASARGIVTLRSPHPFPQTVRCLLDAFAARGVKVFAIIDQQAEAAAAGLTMPRTTLIVFGNPRAGTPLMLAQPLAALDLPLKLLVTESAAEEVTVAFNAVSYIIARHALPAALAANLAGAEKLIGEALRA